MNHLKPSHSVSLPIPKDSFASDGHRHPSRRNRKTNFSLRGDASPKVELPPLPRWMLHTPINTKFPMIPAPKGKIVLFTTDLCKTLHPAPHGHEFDPGAQGVSSEYQSLHDPHLKNHYWNSDSFDSLVRGGFVTRDGKVKCTLKEFNDFQQYLKRVRLEKMDQNQKQLLEIEREEKELLRYNTEKTAEQLARQKRMDDTQKRWRKNNRDRQKRLKRQLDAYDAKHACIITDQFIRHQIDEVQRELEEQKRLNHKLQMEKEEHEKKITYLKKRATEERRRANMLEQRQITCRENREKLLEEKWERKLMSKDSRFARDYLQKMKSNSKLNEDVNSRKRKTQLSWLKQEADLARITEARMKKAADEEFKITKNLEKKLGIIRKRFECKLKKLHAMLRSGGIPPVIQLHRTHQFADRKIEWNLQQDEMKHQCELESELEREMRRQRAIERRKAKALARERAEAASIPPPVTCVELLNKSVADLPIVTVSSHRSWAEAMSRTGLSVEVLPPIKPTPDDAGEDVEPRNRKVVKFQIVEPTDDEIVDDGRREDEMHRGLAREFVTNTMEIAVAKQLVHSTVEEAVLKNATDASFEEAVALSLVEESLWRAVSVASDIDTREHEESVLEIPSVVEAVDATIEKAVASSIVEEAMWRAVSVASDTREPEEPVPVIPSVVEAIVDDDAIVSPEADESRISLTVYESKVSSLACETIISLVADENDLEEVSPAKSETESEEVVFKDTPSITAARYYAVAAIDSACGDLDSQRETRISPVADEQDVEEVSPTKSQTESEEMDFKDTPSITTARYIAVAAIGSACGDLENQRARPTAPRRTPFRQTPSDMARQLADETLDDVAVTGAYRKTPSNIGRGIARNAVEDSVFEVSQEEYELRQTPSNVGRHLATSVMLGAVDELDEITEAKLCLTFKDKATEEEVTGTSPDAPKKEQSFIIPLEITETSLDVPEQTPIIVAKDFAVVDVPEQTPSIVAIDVAVGDVPEQTPIIVANVFAVGDALDKLQDMADNYLGIDGVPCAQRSDFGRDLDRVPCAETPSDLARDLADDAIEDAAEDIKKTTECTEVETKLRQTRSNVARKLAKGSIVRAKDDLDESTNIYRARKESFYKSRSSEFKIKLEPVVKPRKIQSESSRDLERRALESATRVLEQEPPARKTPSDLARNLAESAIGEVTKDLETDPVMHVIYRRTPSNLARFLAEDTMQDVEVDLKHMGKHLVRKTPSNVARSLAKGAVVDAAQEINDQVSQYTTPSPVRKTPSDMGRGIAEGVLSDAVGELELEGKQVDGALRSTQSNVARGLTKTAVIGAGEELDRQSPIYILPEKFRRTPSDAARAVTGDVMTEAIGELESGGQLVEGTTRKTPSNLSRRIVESVISDAGNEFEQGTPKSRTYLLKGKTSSSIAREIASDALIDGIDDMEGEGKLVDGIHRKTPSNLGRFLAQEAIGEALGELDIKIPQSRQLLAAARSRDTMAPAPSLVTAQDLATDAIKRAAKDLQGSVSTASLEGDDLEFNDEDLKEIWGYSSELLASVMDVFSRPSVAVASGVTDDDEEDEEEVIGVLQNALISDDGPILTKSGPSLTDIVHVTDDGKVVVEGAVKISSSEGASLTSSVTEAALSFESLTKNASGQLIRESSSESSAGEATTSKLQPDEDDRKGLRYFKVVPLYNNKLVDVGDEIVKTNLSAISIKPDIKKGLPGAHQPHCRNSFRNIFRPDMTHCEGSAKCLKDTLVSQLSQQSSSEMRKKVLDECCKVLEEEQPDITAKHSDEELVTIGDVEGVCLWPKRKNYKAHVIDEPVAEAEVEEERSGELQTSVTKDTQTGIKIDESTDTKIVKESDSTDITSKAKSRSGGILSSVVSKISDVFRKRSSVTSANEGVVSAQKEERLEQKRGEHGEKIKPSPQEEITHASGSDDVSKNYAESKSQEGCLKKASVSRIEDSDVQVVLPKFETECVKDVETGKDEDVKHDVENMVPQEKQASKSTDITEENSEKKEARKSAKITQKRERKSDEMNVDTDKTKSKSNVKMKDSDIICDNDNRDVKVSSSKSTGIQHRKSSSEVTQTVDTKVSRNKSGNLDSNASSKQSLAMRKSSSASIPRKKSNVSIIYVKPADPKLSRSSCTVLRAGKSISRTSDGSLTNQRAKTPSKESRRRSSHEVKTLKSTSRDLLKPGGARSAGLPAARAGSEEAGLRQFKSLTAVRKLSHQVMPTSSHRILEMATKLSHSASELEGTRSEVIASSDQSAEINMDAMWPVSRPASSSRPTTPSQCGSEWTEEGTRTPPEESGSLSQPDIVKKPSPRACPEQLTLNSKQIPKKQSPCKDDVVEVAAHLTAKSSASCSQKVADAEEISDEKTEQLNTIAGSEQHASGSTSAAFQPTTTSSLVSEEHESSSAASVSRTSPTASHPPSTHQVSTKDHPSVIRGIISRVFSFVHHTPSSSHHHVKHEGHHPGSVLQAIVSRVMSIGKKKSNRVVPVTDDDCVAAESDNSDEESDQELILNTTNIE